MLSHLGVENVRLFESPRWDIPLRPLTLYCGTNSAGKSTLLKVPLLLRQTQEATYGQTNRLCMGGPYADFGSFYTLISNNDVSRDLGISVSAPVRVRAVLLRGLGLKRPRRDADGTPLRVECKVSATFSFGGDPETGGLSERDSSAQVPTRALLKSADFVLEVTDSPNASLAWSLKRGTATGDDDDDSHYEMRVPTQLLERLRADWLIPLRREGDTAVFNAILDGLFPSAWLAETKHKKGDAPSPMQHVPLPPILFNAMAALARALDGLHYLGPVRAPPKRYYISQDRDLDFDISGEALPLLLSEAADRQVEVPIPSGGPGKVLFKDALNQWLAFLRTGDRTQECATEVAFPRMKDVFEFRLLGPNSRTHALADSGFGYSQVLPIVVRGLLAEAGESVIVEQPELHLNPALQVRLVDFFVAIVKAGRQVLLETHSEHIVNAVRVAIAEDSSGQLAGMTSMIYVGSGTPRPVVSHLAIDENGAVPEWPSEFMGEAMRLAGRLLRAQRRPPKGRE